MKNENDNFLKSVNEILENFKDDHGKNLEQIISELINLITDLNLDNINTAFNESLYFTFQNITNIILNNTKFAYQYFEDVQIQN